MITTSVGIGYKPGPPRESTPLTVGFDAVSFDRDAHGMSVSPPPGNADRPVWNYWFPVLCWLSPGRIRPACLAELDVSGAPWVYPLELRYEADEWCADAPADQPLAVLPPAVERALTRQRVLIVLSLMHEGRALFRAEDPEPALLLDRVAAFARWYGLSADELWFLSGNLDAAADVEAWRRLRGLSKAPFTLRALEPFSAFVGGCTREGLDRGRAPAVAVSFDPHGPHAVGWQGTRVGWVPAPFPSLGEHPAAEPARFRYACLNRMFRAHRWKVLTRLSAEDLLNQGLISFARPSEEDLSLERVDGTGGHERELLARLPLTVDKQAHLDETALFGDNSAFVALHPPAVLRDCAMEVVTETKHAGCRFVSEKAFKALLGRGPAAIIGTRGTLAYLRSIGIRSWPDHLDEHYDDIDDPDERLAAAMDAAVRFMRRPDWAAADARVIRSGNLRWLTEARKPWDELVGEFGQTLRQM